MQPLKITATSIIVFFTVLASAQNSQLEFGAEFRPRVIVDNGYSSPKTQGENTPVYTTQRTRLNAHFTVNNIESYISFQDVRLWGADNNYKSSGTYGDTESLGLHQGWVKMNLTQTFSLKVGRQIFSYDDQRVISARNWNDYQVTYDALLAEYKTENHRIHLGLTYNAESKNNILFPDDKFKSFDFIHYQFTKEKLNLSAIAVLTENTLNDTTEQVYFRGTYGLNINYKTARFKSRLSAYYQHNLNDNGGKISAYCLSAFIDYNIIDKLNLGIGLDYLSGNDNNSTSTVNHRFDILYGRRHSWYGYMDYFSTTPDQGLQDFMAKLSYKPKSQLNLELDYHYFRLARDMYKETNPSEKLSNKLGQEIDLKLNWKIQEALSLECGYSFYMTTNTLKQVKNVAGNKLMTPQFCYVALSVTPTYLFQ